MNGRKWTDEEIKIVEDGYKNNLKISEICEQLTGRTKGSVQYIADLKGFNKIYIKKNSVKFKAIYQDYDWCYEKYIVQGMSHDEMAKEAGCKKRVLVKWCTDIHGLHNRSFRKLKHLSDLQRRIIIAGLLGDGHIPKDDEHPMYIESHSEGEFDYLFWKYSILKDLCSFEPTYYDAPNGYENSKPFYRLSTRCVDELFEIRDIPRIDKISGMDELQLSCHTLDDGNRSDLWYICLAEYTEDEINKYIEVVRNKFNLRLNKCKDERYCFYDAISSRRLDEIILRNIPNDLDIIHKKILENKNIKSAANYRFLIYPNGDRIGLSTYCKKNHIDYESAIAIFDSFKSDFNEVSLDDFLMEKCAV